MKSLQSSDNDSTDQQCSKPFVSLVVPAYNEAAIIEKNLTVLCQNMVLLENDYRWEIIIVNDGSIDKTEEIIESFAENSDNIHALHHSINLGLGQALQTGFNHCQGDYIITLDLDLSYSPSHIQKLLAKIRETQAKLVVASPYMKGGKVSNVPWLRQILSRGANRFLSFAVKGKIATLTGMVRAYDADFLKTLKLKSNSMDINPEIIHKALLLNAQIDEIPAHLNWLQQAEKGKRKSSMKILRQTFAVLLSGFILRPVVFFIAPSFILFLLALYANIWGLIDIFTNYQKIGHQTRFPHLTEAVVNAFNQAPHIFIIGGMTLMLAIQLLSLGILSLQSKSYFEEIFYLGTAIYKANKRIGTENE